MKFKSKHKKSKRSAEISTASLPDIVFMLLFFFMVATVMKQQDPLVSYTLPDGSELEEVEEIKLTASILMGNNPNQKEMKQLQLNKQLVTLDQLTYELQLLLAKVPEADKNRFMVVLKVDKDEVMEHVRAVKLAIRDAQIFMVNYTVLPQA